MSRNDSAAPGTDVEAPTVVTDLNDVIQDPYVYLLSKEGEITMSNMLRQKVFINAEVVIIDETLQRLVQANCDRDYNIVKRYIIIKFTGTLEKIRRIKVITSDAEYCNNN